MCLSGLCISFQETGSVFICVFGIGLSLRRRKAIKAVRKQYPSTADCSIRERERERVYNRAEVKKRFASSVQRVKSSFPYLLVTALKLFCSFTNAPSCVL